MRSFRQSRFSWSSIFLMGLAAFVFVGGCGSDDDDESPQEPSIPAVSRADVVVTNADIAFAGYSDALATAVELQTAVDALVNDPTMATHEDAKDAWRKAREAYQPTEVYRFRPGPIEDLTDAGTLVEGEGPEARINGWPLGEALVDYVAGGSPDGDPGDQASVEAAGLTYPMNLISDTRIDVSDEETLKTYVEFMDDRNVGTGYHAIEFLLWGQDLNGGETMWTTPRDHTAGQRPVSDYYQNDNCTSGPAKHDDGTICTRRATYLQTATELLVDDLQAIVDAWDPDGSFYADYIANPNASLARILESMARMAFGELAGERMNIALLDNSQEDEHSCFSDNTHRDILLNVVGVQNQFLGEYDLAADALDEFTFDNNMITGRGHGVYDLLKAEGHGEIAEALKMAIDDAVTLAMVIDTKARDGMPFDQQIEDSSQHADISAVIRTLGQVVVQIEAAIEALKGIDIDSDDLLQDTCQEIDNRSGTADDCPEI